MTQGLASITHEDALRYILKCIRLPEKESVFEYSHYGYDLYLPNLMRIYFYQELKRPSHEEAALSLRAFSPSFYSAAWELCRRGILRPGIARHGLQETKDGSAGNGYSITPFGRSWLQEQSHDEFVPTEPERFGQMISKFKDLLGPGFHQRAQEAVRCYGAHAFLACTAMCGAAIESALLSLAVVKVGNETEVLERYSAANGRSYLEQLILKDSNEYQARELRGFLTLLKYWRDTSAHGKPTTISDNEAFTSLALLLRCSAFLEGNWQRLTSQ